MKAINLSDIVTLVIDHKVRAGQRADYEDWLKRAVALAREQTGHLGVNVIRPESDSGTFTIVIRFAEAGQLDEWVNSDLRRQMIEEVLPLLEEGDHPVVHADAEFWFTPSHPEVRQPPKWKQAALTYGIILPLSISIPLLWQPVFQRFPFLKGLFPSNILITLCIVLLVVYLIMPWATRRLSGWLNA